MNHAPADLFNFLFVLYRKFKYIMLYIHFIYLVYRLFTCNDYIMTLESKLN